MPTVSKLRRMVKVAMRSLIPLLFSLLPLAASAQADWPQLRQLEKTGASVTATMFRQDQLPFLLLRVVPEPASADVL